jgi:hypothetical protein
MHCAYVRCMQCYTSLASYAHTANCVLLTVIHHLFLYTCATYILSLAVTLQQPCRHFLNGECLRRDCVFSHDFATTVCRYWLQVRYSTSSVLVYDCYKLYNVYLLTSFQHTLQGTALYCALLRLAAVYKGAQCSTVQIALYRLLI